MYQETIFGPPGTGKTTTLIARLVALLGAGYAPGDICYTSFTRVAADVARARAVTDADADGDDLEWFGTLHALCGRLLDFDWRSDLLSEQTDKGRTLLLKFGRDEGFTFDFTSDVDGEADALTGEGAEGNQLLSWWNWARQCCLPVDEAIARWRAVAVTTLAPARQHRFVTAYTEFKQDLGASDFTDILVMADRRGLLPPVRALFVDEAQDLSPLQWRILDRWRNATEVVYLGGDDDQAIYAWQGADAALFLERARQGTITTLSQSYRLPRASHAVTTYLSGRIRERMDKPFAAQSDHGLAVERPLFRLPLDNREPWFVLARNTFLLKDARTHLEDRGLPYAAKRGFDPVKVFYPAARAITALAEGQGIDRGDLAGLVRRLEAGRDYDPYLARRLSPSRLRELPRLITQADLPELGFGEAFMQRLRQEPLPARMLTLTSARGYRLTRTWNYLVRLQRDHGRDVFERTPAITLSTVHGVKGDEAENVALITDMARASARTLADDPDSEHRVWYVGVSRARRNLYVLPPATEIAYPPLATGAWKRAVAVTA